MVDIDDVELLFICEAAHLLRSDAKIWRRWSCTLRFGRFRRQPTMRNCLFRMLMMIDSDLLLQDATGALLADNSGSLLQDATGDVESGLNDPRLEDAAAAQHQSPMSGDTILSE
jgi:hypothetical protein